MHKYTYSLALFSLALAASLFFAPSQAQSLDFRFRIPFLRNPSLPDNAAEEMREEERISEVLNQDVNYRQIFNSIRNPAIPLNRYVAPGEDLRYQAVWRGLPAGSIRMAAKRMGVIRGRSVIVFELNAKSNDFLSTFYPVNTSANSYVDAIDGKSYLIRRRISERNRSYKDRLEFKYDYRLPNGLPDPVCKYSFVGQSGAEETASPIPIPGAMQDIVSSIYYVRGMNLKKVGDTCSFLLGGRTKPGIMTLEVVAEETLRIPGLGDFDCLIIEPYGDGTNISGNLVASRGSERVWLERNTLVPVQISAELPAPLGTIVATLTRAENCPILRFARR